MDQHQILISRIEDFAKRHGLTESTVCRMAANDGKLIGRIRKGGSVSLRTFDNILRFLDERDRGVGEMVQ